MAMTMFRPYSALAAPICIYLLAVAGCLAQDSTTTHTLTLTTIVTTSTTTITLGQSTFASTTVLPVTTVPEEFQSTSPTSMAGSDHGVYGGSEFRDAVLNSTNSYREMYQAAPVTWDDTLASYAQDHAEKCEFEHSGGDYGENLALNYETPTLAIDGWAGEEKKYDFSEGKFGEKTGHFTQLVWRGTKSVGCGAVECNSDDTQGWLLVCEYDPPGNVVGTFKDNIEKAGAESGNLGMGAASRMGGSARLLVALVAVSSLAAVCL